MAWWCGAALGSGRFPFNGTGACWARPGDVLLVPGGALGAGAIGCAVLVMGPQPRVRGRCRRLGRAGGCALCGGGGSPERSRSRHRALPAPTRGTPFVGRGGQALRGLVRGCGVRDAFGSHEQAVGVDPDRGAGDQG